jgi:hypothetical protein
MFRSVGDTGELVPILELQAAIRRMRNYGIRGSRCERSR